MSKQVGVLRSKRLFSVAPVLIALAFSSLTIAGVASIIRHASDTPGSEAAKQGIEGLLPLTLDLGAARRFNGFFLESFTSVGSDTEGGLAAGGNISLNHYSVGDRLKPGFAGISLLAGGDIHYPNGRVYHGDILAGGSTDGIGMAVLNGLSPSQSVHAFAPLPFSFPAEQATLLATSARLAALPANGTASWQWGGLYLSGDCSSPSQVFQLDGAQVLAAHTFSVSCIPAGATVIFNISGVDTGLTNMSLESLAPHRQRTLYNFHEAQQLRLSGIGVQGTILAPRAHVAQPQGVIHGSIFARSWNGPMQLNHVPFKGVGAGDFCAMYPIALPHDVLANAAPGDVFSQLPRGTGPGQFSWLTWAGSPSAPTLATSLVPPGDSYGYVNPDDDSDWLLSPGDWAQGAPGNMNSAAVRQNLDALLGAEIAVPAWSQVRGQGNNFDYRVAQFARVRLTDYQLTGQGWLSFEFLGFTHCYNRPPEAFDQSLSTAMDAALDIVLTGADPDGDAIAFDVIEQPVNGILEADGTAVRYIPNPGFVGADSFRFVARDAYLSSVPATVTIDVVHGSTNAPPQIVSDPVLTGHVGETYLYPVVAVDPDVGDVLTYSLVDAPAGMDIDAQTGLIAWVPTAAQIGSHPVSVRVVDLAGASDQQDYTVAVSQANRPPQIVSDPVLTGHVGETYLYAVVAVDPDIGDVLTYSLVDAPAGMDIDAQTGLIAWVPTATQIGSHPVSVRVVDLAGASDQQDYTVAVSQANRPPQIVSDPVLTGYVGETYLYAVVAVDPDIGDVLTYSLVDAPAGMDIDAQTGLIAWVPTAAQIGSHPVSVRVVDLAGASDQQDYTVAVAEENLPPTIISPPVHHAGEDTGYRYDVVAVDPNPGDVVTYALRHGPPSMSIDAGSGRIDWSPGSEWAGNNLLDNPMCLAGGGAQSVVVAAADVVIVVDESGSMSGEHEWIADIAAPLEAHLASNGIGDGSVPNRYGLIGYEAAPRPLSVGGGPMGGYLDLIDATNLLRISGGTEDGWRAIRHALTQYPLRDEAARNIILITDEDRDNADSAITYASILADLQNARAVLNAVVDARFRCGDNSPALGLGQAGIGYKADGRGGFVTCGGAVAHSGGGTTIVDYVNLALATGGAAWDLNFLRQGGVTAQSFTNALLNIKVREILEQIPPRPLADLVVRDLRAYDGAVSVDIGNRGLIDVDHAFQLVFSVDGVVIASQTVDGLAAGADQTIGFAWQPSAGSPPQLLTAGIEADPATLECHASNNDLSAAWAEVRASDPHDLYDEQGFSVSVRDANAAPVIDSQPVTTAVIGARYRYRVLASDPDRGDSLEYRLVTGPAGMAIDRLSGEILFRPDAGQEGDHPVEVRVRDLVGLEVAQQFTLAIDRSYLPPRFTSAAQRRAVQGTLYQYQAVAEGDPLATLSYDVFLGPPGFAMDPVTGLVSWQVPMEFLGRTHYVVLRVRDQIGNYDLQVYTLIGDRPNEAPHITSNPGLSATQGSAYAYSPTVTDINVLEEFTWRLDIGPDGSQVNAGTGRLDWAAASVTTTVPAKLAQPNPMCFISEHPVTPLVAPRPRLTANYPRTATQPLIGPLADTNFDGVLDHRDLVAAVAVSWTDGGSNNRRIHAINARTGAVLWSHNQRLPDWYVLPAMADLSSQGEVAIVFVDNQKQLVALNHDGSVRWVGSAPVANSNQTLNYNAISIADLDADGRAEILIGPSVFGHDGQLRWQFPLSTNGQGQSLAVDLDGDGRMEVLYRGEVRDADGTLIRQTPSTSDATVNYAFFASARLTGSTRPDIVISENTNRGNRLTAMRADGSLIWQLGSPQVARVGAPLVLDVDRDGVDEIFLPASGQLFNAVGGQLWSIGGTSAWTARDFRAAATADLDGDGHLELLAFGNGALQIWSASTGALLAADTAWADGGHYSMTPAIVDPFGTGGALIAAGGTGGIRLYEPADGVWRADARIANQQAFARDRVRDDFSVPPAGAGSFPAPLQQYAAAAAGQVATHYLPDLRTSAPYGRQEADGIRVSVDVVNRGTGPSRAFVVRFYRGQVDDPDRLIGEVASAALSAGQTVTLSLAQLSHEAAGETEVFARIVPHEDELECEAGNNLASGRIMQIAVADHGSLEASQRWLVGVNESLKTPRFTSTASLTAVENVPYGYASQAVSDHVGDVLYFDFTQAPAEATVHPRSGEVRWTPAWGQTGQQRFTLRATSLNGRSISQTWNVQVAVSTVPNTPPELVSLPITQASLGQVYRYQAEAVDPDGDALTYALTQAPAGMQIDAQTGLVLWIPSSPASAPVPVSLRVTDARGATDTQTFEITVHTTVNHPPSITSTPDLSVNLGDAWSYTVIASDPDGDALQYLWLTAPDGASFDLGSLTLGWTPDAGQVGIHPFQLEVRDARGGWARQSFSVYVNDGAQNQPPTITSSAPLAATVNVTYQYQAEANDPDGDAITWSLALAPPGMSVDSATGAVGWTPTLAQVGGHPVELIAADGRGGVAWQRFTVIVQEAGPGNRPPRITSAPATTAKTGRPYRYVIVATDPDGDTPVLSLSEGPSGMQLDPATGELSWTPAQVGSYPVRVRAADAEYWVEQSWTLSVIDGSVPLSVSLAANPRFVLPGESVQVDIYPEAAAGQVQASLTLDGVVVPVDASLQAIVSAQDFGRRELAVTITDGFETASATGEFFVRDPASANAPVVTLSTPEYEERITAPTIVIGSVADDDLDGWVLAYQDRAGGVWTTLAEGGDVLSDAEIATFDPTMLLNGQYVIALQAWDAGGNVGTDSRVVVVDGDMKVGHFSITFEDVSIPLSGIPITVSRTYDTRRRNDDLDFGHGWSVDYQNVRIHESRTIGLGWSLNEYRQGFFSTWCVQPNGDPIVTVTLPDGQVERFKAKASPECQQLVPVIDVNLVFEPLPGTYSTLAQTTYGMLRLVNGNLINLGDVGLVNPDHYRLTTKDGMAYELDQSFGIRRVRDLDGNTLTYSANGIVHSSGVGVQFVRDGNGRISQIALPDGEFIDYGYSVVGDLTSVADQVGNVTQFTYLPNLPHYLRDILDPRGVRVARNEYDDSGRLIAHIDADGNRIEYDFDVEGRIQQVKNRRGHVTTYVFDDEGRVTAETNALGETTLRSYDAYGNELTQTNALGHTTTHAYDARGNHLSEQNALGQTTTWTYNNRGQTLTERDAGNTVVSTNVYSSGTGALTSTTDALGNVTGMGYSSAGNLTRLTDALGQDTTWTYDSRGNRLTQTDAQGHVTRFTYDSGGRVLSETRSRIDAGGAPQDLVTTYEYDAGGRLVKTTDPLGHVTRTEYNAIDKESATVDALGRRTEYDYDARGNQVLIRYPDGTTEQKVYDEENNLVGESDRAGRTTLMVYDAANRLIETIHPDATPDDDGDNPRTKNEYDAAGRLVATENERGHRTTFTYDAADRKISETDALGNTTTYAYDARGLLIQATDALGRRTKYVYDAARRLIETIHPDTTSSDNDNPRTRVQYDAVGRKTRQTDEANRATNFEYDAQGRLAAVIDNAGQRTEYEYDEQDNKTVQRDALGRETRWTYDAAGRPSSRTLPLGQVEQYGYDAVGRRTSHVDFNGATTTTQYDSTGRPVRVDYADGHSVVTTYTASGQVASLTDRHGTTNYQYDARDRLIRVTYPDAGEIAYEYDAAGNRTRLLTAHQDVAYTYDALNRLATVTDAAGTTSYGYTAVGSRSHVVLPTGARADYTYNVRNRLTNLVHRSALGAALLSLTYTVDASGLRTRIQETGHGTTRTVNYQYDTLARLTQEQVTHSTLGNRTSTWTYDAVGNRLTQVRTKGGVTESIAYVYDANDRLLTETRTGGALPGVTTHEYDANGSLIQRSGPEGLNAYAYDAATKMVQAVTPAGTVEYTYDADGLRQSQTAGGETTRYLVDPNQPYAQVIEERDIAGQAQAIYTVGDDRIGQHMPDGQGGIDYHAYHADGLGSTRLLTDESGAAAARLWYEAFGETEARTGTADTDFRYTGEQLDPNLGWYYLRARYMDPARGRFAQMDEWLGVQCDPITLNKFAYANANPTGFVDPSGHAATLSGLMSGLSGSMILQTGVRSFAVAKIRGKGFKKLTCQIGASYVKREFARDSVEGHHPIPRNVGGASDQELIFLPANTHRMFHWVLHVLMVNNPEFKGMGNWTSGRDWDAISRTPAGRRALYRTILIASRLVDRACDLRRPNRLADFVQKNRRGFLGER